jgi:hypothetical protein
MSICYPEHPIADGMETNWPTPGSTRSASTNSPRSVGARQSTRFAVTSQAREANATPGLVSCPATRRRSRARALRASLASSRESTSPVMLMLQTIS